MPPSPEFDSLAAALAGQYALEREIGRGGMGVVYLARDLRLDRPVAIKTLPPHLASDPAIRERFLREARTAAKLSHPNIVPIYRADEIDGHVFFAMGYVDGASIADLVRERTHIDPREVLRHMRDVASALGYASAHGVVHRDVKAENILIERATGRAMVTDFGIARLAEAAPLTATGQVLGTVYYMSPEQVSGDALDGRSDLYSLGVVGYYELTGRFPFDATLASAVLISHVNKAAPPVLTVQPSAPRALAEVIDRCLAKDPAARYASGDEMAEALTRIEPEVARDAARVDAVPYAPKLVSDTEAQQIWDRAAALQAQTGVVPRTPPSIPPRDLVADATRTSGYALSAVRDAAVEAGIPAQYVDHALAEHGLARTPGAEPRAQIKISDRSVPPSRLYGASTNVEYEAVVNGEMPEGDFDLLVDTIRRRMEMAGAVNAVGRSLTWTTLARNRSAHVSVVSRNGKTTIRIAESMEWLARRSRIIAAVGTAYLAAGSAALLGGVHRAGPLLAIGAAVAAFGAVAAASRFSFASSVKKRQRRFRGLLEELAGQARESIEGEARGVRSGERGRLGS